MILKKWFLVAVVLCCAATGVWSADNKLADARGILANLIQDNAQFVKEKDASYFASFKNTQSPRATVVLCCDSRVHVHALDRTPDNDLFVVRTIGNQVAFAEGSIEYGVRYLKTPLLLVVGHSGCGAIKAAMGDVSALEPAIQRELQTLNVFKKDANSPDNVRESVEKNVLEQCAAAIKKYQPAVDSGALFVVGAVYDFENAYGQGKGRLVFLSVNGDSDAAKFSQMPVFVNAAAPATKRAAASRP